MRSRWVLPLVLVVGLTAAACSATDRATSATPAPSVSVTMGDEGPTVTPVSLPGLTMDASATESQDLQVHVQWPVIPGATKLNEQMASWAQGREKAFRADVKPSSEQPPEINISAAVFIASGRAAAARLTEYAMYGASGATTNVTFYGGADGSWAIQGRDIFADAKMGDVIEALLSAVPKADQSMLATLKDRNVLLDDAIIGPDGSVTLSLRQGMLTPYSDGTPHVTFPAAKARPWLGSRGRAVVDSLKSGSPYQGSATESPTSGATPDNTAPAPSAPEQPAPQPPAGGSVDCAALKCVALTYDDGPSRYTSELLDHLAAARVPATLFVVGQNVARNAAVLKRADAQGIEIANHTWSHRDLAKLGPDQAKAEVQKTQDALQAAIGKPATLLRPPYGSHNAGTAQLGLPLILWDVDTLDWQNRNAATTTARALATVRAGSIILMHDIHPSSVAATPGIIAELKNRGFTLVTVSQLVGTPAAGTVVSRLGG